MKEFKFTEVTFAATLLLLFCLTTENEDLVLGRGKGIYAIQVEPISAAMPISSSAPEIIPRGFQKPRFTKGGLINASNFKKEAMTGPASTAPPGSIIVGDHWHHPNDSGVVFHRERTGSTGRLGVWLKPVRKVDKSRPQ